MKKLAEEFALAKPETVVIISPHGPVQMDAMTITAVENLSGNFAQFGDFKTELLFKNDLKIIEEIKKAADKAEIPVDLLDIPQLDHGALVPLYYLTNPVRDKISNGAKNYPNLKLIPIAFSYLDYQTHFQFGQILGRIINDSQQRIAFIASGDLSHRITPDAPAGYSLRGKEFDEKLIELLKKNDAKGILNLDPDLIEEAGECGLRSIIVLLGALSLNTHRFLLLSYEAPFGVGYLVATFSPAR